ncbi:XRE family transcriptional regulator [Xylanimonas oleitrophica]|uniref:XRE family transcriptional regulator n=1 Tax=Xylanimonas oleitrophica TaxID=2607479 RepID=A0A2W5WST7_9MICO|nr:ImmA/IrrE family metallo-endopeptidase [Xylanimonas oleitrophica]PZR54190.1 XRE family transcriptional regulator [Xylanimonas oleitrophica]
MSSLAAEPTRLSNAAIREYAERIGEHYNIYDRAGTADVRALVRELGGSIAIGDTRESLRVIREGQFVIYLPRVTSSRRDRFTIAHELGHYFLHYLHAKRADGAIFGRGERNDVETQANVFAASLLMPAEPFRKTYARLRGDTHAIARILEVSPAAVEVRAQVLGLR